MLRKMFIAERQHITFAYRQQAATMAANIFTQQTLFTQSRHIACYLACMEEFDSQPLIKAIWQAKKGCYLPVVTKEKLLQFVQYTAGDDLRRNQYSILEPSNTANIIPLPQLDIVIIPLVAFDSDGCRIGSGSGCYDRTFAFRREQHEFSKPWLLGLAYAKQQAAKLPVDTWDVNLDGVLTEKGLRSFI